MSTPGQSERAVRARLKVPLLQRGSAAAFYILVIPRHGHSMRGRFRCGGGVEVHQAEQMGKTDKNATGGGRQKAFFLYKRPFNLCLPVRRG